jgi:aminoglycoside phosphotransferase (APT) family kinase protein
MVEAVPIAAVGALIPAEALAALAAVMRGPLRAARLPGGRGVNLCLRVEDDSGRCLALRVRRGPGLAGADAHRELAAQRLAGAAGLAPDVIRGDAAQGWMLMEYLEAAPWGPEDLRDGVRLRRLGERLRRLHALPPPAFAPMDGLRLLQSHCDALAAHGQDRARSLLQRGGELIAQLALVPPRPPVLCHGDPDAANFLGAAPMLVDFEYAQIADPVYDAALLLAYYPFLEPHREALLAAMGLADVQSRRRLPLQIDLCEVINSAWARVGALPRPLD